MQRRSAQSLWVASTRRLRSLCRRQHIARNQGRRDARSRPVGRIDEGISRRILSKVANGDGAKEGPEQELEE